MAGKPGPKSEEHKRNIARAMTGSRNHRWKGDEAQPQAGRLRARRLYPMPDKCDRCEVGKPRDRHHIDGNPLNNEPSNITFLCPRCHMEVDGRLEKITEFMRTKPWLKEGHRRGQV